MKKTIAIGAFLLSTSVVWAQAYVQDEVLVRFKDGQQGLASVVHKSFGTTVKSSIPKINVERIKLPAGMTVTQAIALYKANSAVMYAEPNYKKSKRLTPNDPSYNTQYAPQKMRLPLAWDLSLGTSVSIAIIDDGVDIDHPDLQPVIDPRSRDLVDNDNDPSPPPGDIHGTHVAGCASAATNNGIGIAGVGYNAKIIGLRFDYTTAGSAGAMIYAADIGANIVNMSYGSYGPPSQTESNAVDYAHGKNVLLISASGNANTNTLDSYPDGFLKVISVGATNASDVKTSFSDYGPRVDVAAPGESILSTLPDGGYGNLSGTSMSSPGVCGVAAIIWAYAGLSTPNTEIRNILETTSVNVGTWLNTGRVDAWNAINAVGVVAPFDFAPISYSVVEGTETGGDLQSLAASDDDRLTIDAVAIPKTGYAAASTYLFDIDRPMSNLRKANLKLEVGAVNRATMLVFFWSWTQNKFVSFKQYSMTQADGTINIRLDNNLKKWVNANGEFKIMLRAFAANKAFKGKAPMFEFRNDRTWLDTQFKL